MIPSVVIEKVLELGVAALKGHIPGPAEAARALVAIGLELVPVDDLRRYLDAEDAARIDRQVDAVVEFKFGRPPEAEEDEDSGDP